MGFGRTALDLFWTVHVSNSWVIWLCLNERDRICLVRRSAHLQSWIRTICWWPIISSIAFFRAELTGSWHLWIWLKDPCLPDHGEPCEVLWGLWSLRIRGVDTYVNISRVALYPACLITLTMLNNYTSTTQIDYHKHLAGRSTTSTISTASIT